MAGPDQSRQATERTRGDVVAQLRALGVAPGGVLVVHTGFSKVGPVEGGPRGLIDALRTALGRVGGAEARLARSRDIVAAVTAHLAQDETVFLHPPGVDAECDEARASLPR